MKIPRYAIIPSNGRECLDSCIKAISGQVDTIILVKTAEYVRYGHAPYSGLLAINVLNPDINISRWWNHGLDFLDDIVPKHDPGPTRYDVAILNDDVIVPEGWFDAVAGKMRDMRAVGASSGAPEGRTVLHTHSGQRDLATRLQGFAFIVAGETGIRADEQFRWYCGDDDLEWRLSALGGVVVIPTHPVQHLYPNGQVTPEMQVLIAEDMQRFVDKWGVRPW